MKAATRKQENVRTKDNQAASAKIEESEPAAGVPSLSQTIEALTEEKKHVGPLCFHTLD